MYCMECGAEVVVDAKFCNKCGTRIEGEDLVKEVAPIIRSTNLSAPIYSGPNDEGKPSLWNPNAAANWSAVFSPIFGAWLHSKNWSALGDDKKASQSMYWVYAGFVLASLAIFLPAKDVTGGLTGAYLFAWYFTFARQQVKFVKDKFASSYKKKPWEKPIGIAVAAVVAFLAVGYMASGKTMPECGDPNVQALVIKYETDKYADIMDVKEFEPIAARTSALMDLATNGTGLEYKKPFFQATGKNGTNLKLDAITSTKKDKESGFNYCSAMLTGAITGEWKIAPAPGNEIILTKFREMIENGSAPRDVRFMLSSIGGPMSIGGILASAATTAAKQPGVASATYDERKLELIIRLDSDLDEVTYTANLTDKGDQLLVKVLKD